MKRVRVGGEAMDRDYWDSMGKTYSHKLLEIADEAGGEALHREIARHGSPNGRAADLGCGPGSLLPLLAEHFGEVVAVDYASRLLEAARRRCQAENVSYRQHDLTRDGPLGFKADLICCVNVLIDPDRGKREAVARTVSGAVRKDGVALVVVPAFESVVHVYRTLIEIRARVGSPSGLSEGEAERMFRSEVESVVEGIVRVGGVRTKYWLRDELLALMQRHGFVPKRVLRVGYDWGEEIENFPDGLDASPPWDWLVVARRA